MTIFKNATSAFERKETVGDTTTFYDEDGGVYRLTPAGFGIVTLPVHAREDFTDALELMNKE